MISALNLFKAIFSSMKRMLKISIWLTSKIRGGTQDYTQLILKIKFRSKKSLKSNRTKKKEK